MGRAYDFEDTDGNGILPVGGGPYYTADMSSDYEGGHCFLIFYDSDGETPVTPSGGTVVFKSAAIEGQYLDAASGGTVDATTVGTTYSPAVFNSLAVKSEMTLTGITGASFVRAIHWRFG